MLQRIVKKLSCLSVPGHVCFTLIVLAGPMFVPLAHGDCLFDLSGALVNENQPPGSQVGTFNGIGIAMPNYSLTPGSGDNYLFTIDGITLRTAVVFDFETQQTYTIRVSDSNCEQEFTITVSDINESPEIREGDSVTVEMDEDGFPTNFSLTLNATDPDEDILTWAIVSDPENGQAQVDLTGLSQDISYTPDPGYTGTDTFLVQVSDGELTDAITVNVNILSQNAPPEITQGDSVTVEMDEDGSPTGFALTLNAADPDENDTLTWTILTGSENGSAQVDGQGGGTQDIAYTPDPCYYGTDTFTVQVSDGELIDTITVNVTIHEAQPVITNHQPEITQGDAITTDMDEDGYPTAFALTLNADDPDEGDILTWTILTGALNGTAHVSGTGNSQTIAYTPRANYHGTDTFVVQVSDGELSDTITVNVNIRAQNDLPVIAQGDAANLNMTEDGYPADLTLDANDPDGDPLSWTIISNPANGTAHVGPTGNSQSVSYKPYANYTGSDSFAVQVSDGNGGTDTITVYVNVYAENDRPVITQGDSVTVDMDEDAFPIPFSLILNATDPDGDALFWTISTPAGNGTAQASGEGYAKEIAYAPAPGYSGTDSFVVQVSDGHLTDTIVVTVNIASQNDTPVITEGDSVTVSMDEEGFPTPFSLVLNATDPDNDILTWAVITPPENGTAEAGGEGYAKEIAYMPDPGYSGTDSFVVQVSDGELSDTIQINISIGAQNDLPVITEGDTVTVSMDENGSPTPFNLILNATDPDNDILTWTIAEHPQNGTAQVSGEGYSKAISYTPAPGYTGTDTFTVVVSDGEFSDTILVNVNIIPKANEDCASLCEGVMGKCGIVFMDEDSYPQPFDLTLNASDPNNDILTWTISSPAGSGIAYASGTGYTKTINYIPDANYNGTDRFEVQVSDGELTDNLVIYVCIAPQNDPPVITHGDSIEMEEAFELTLNAEDPDGDALTWTIISSPVNGTAYADGTGDSQIVSYIPDDNYNGTDSFIVQVSDGELSDTITVNVTVETEPPSDECTGLCDPDAEECALVRMDEDGFPTRFELTLNASDPDNDILTWSVSTPADNGIAHVSGTGYTKAVSYTPDKDYNGTDQFEVQVSDGYLSDTLMVYVCISPQPDPMNVAGNSEDELPDVPASTDGNRAQADTDPTDTRDDGYEMETLDIGDAILVLQILSGMSTDSAEFSLYDVNGDGKISIEEVIHILQTVSDSR